MQIGQTNIDNRDNAVYGDTTETRNGKDIGVPTDDKRKFSEHLAEKIDKANSTVGLVRGAFTHLDPVVFKPLCTALVRLHLDDAYLVWRPI